MLNVPNILKNFCDTFWEYDVEQNQLYMHHDKMTPEFCGRWIDYDLIYETYKRDYVHTADRAIWEQNLGKERLREFFYCEDTKKHFFIRLYGAKLQWHEAFLEKSGEKTITLMSRDIHTLQRNDAVIKAVDPTFDYVTYINISDKSYILYSSDSNDTNIPIEQSDDYHKILKEFNEKNVVPEEAALLTAQMQIENVVKELEDKDEFVLYPTAIEKGNHRYKKLRFCYLNESKETLLLSRVDITDLVNQQRLRAAEEKKLTNYLDELPIAVCMTRVLLDENNKPYDFEYTYSNQEHAALEGVDCGELTGKRFYEFFKNTDEMWLRYYYETAYLGIPHTIDRYSPEIDKHLLIHTFPSDKGYCGCVVQDITERKFLEQELEKSRENMRHILSETTDKVFRYDMQRDKIIPLNEKQEDMVSIEISSLVKNGFLERDYESAIRNALEDMKSGSHNISVDVRARLDREPRFCWYKVTLSDYTDARTHERKILGYIKNIEDMVRQHEELRKEAQLDSLTGILNARTGKAEIQKRIDRHSRDYYNAMFIMDIDDFKTINDTKGHIEGDKNLITFSQILRSTFRSDDVIYRLGGDEFAVFVENIYDPETNINIMMRRFFTKLKEAGRDGTPISSSVGVYVSREKIDFDEYYKEADGALYQSKKGGKNRYNLKIKE